MKTVILGAMSLGALAALFIPSEWVLVPILVPLILCIFLGWYITIQNGAVQLTPFRLFFWPWVNVTAPLKSSQALRALQTCAALVTGECVGLLIRVANA
jgi:hypothetical protein